MIIKKIWGKIKDMGKKYDMGLAGLDSYEPRRIEAGILNAGSDFDGTTNPFQIGLGKLVDLNKNNFLGKVSLIKTKKTNQLFGLNCQKGIPKWKGCVFKNDLIIGTVTCGTFSPFLQKGIGFVFFDNLVEETNSVVQIECVDGSVQEAIITNLPMYDEDKNIPKDS